jgi:hypothetical protein
MQPACARMPRRVRRDPFVDCCSGCCRAATGRGRWRLAVLEDMPSKPASRMRRVAGPVHLHIYLVDSVMDWLARRHTRVLLHVFIVSFPPVSPSLEPWYLDRALGESAWRKRLEKPSIVRGGCWPVVVPWESSG